MTDFSNSTIAVTGASGHLGRAVLGYLQERGAKHIVAITRDPGKLADLKGVDVRQGDFNDPASLDAAFKGVERLLMISTDTIGAPGGRIVQHTAAIEAAERAGVKFIAYTSIATPYPSATALVANDHFWTEARLTQFKGDWVMLRNDVYADFVDAPRAISSGQLIHASGSGRKALVTRDDCAAAATGALLTSTGRTVEDVTGPQALSPEDIAAAIAEVSGRPITAVAISGEALVGGMMQSGLPENLARAFAAFDTDAARGYYGITGDAVQRLGGRAPTSLLALLQRSKASLAA